MAGTQIDTQGKAGKVVTLGFERLFGQDEVLELYGLAMAMQTMGAHLAKEDLAAGDLVGPSYLFGALARRAGDLRLTLEHLLDSDEITLLVDTVAALRLIAEHLGGDAISRANLHGTHVLMTSLSQKIFQLGERLDDMSLEIQ